MARKRHNAEEIVTKLRQVDVLISQADPDRRCSRVPDAPHSTPFAPYPLENQQSSANTRTILHLFCVTVARLSCKTPIDSSHEIEQTRNITAQDAVERPSGETFVHVGSRGQSCHFRAARAHGATAALFAASIAGRLKGKVLWCVTRPDLFAPSLAQVGLSPGRVIHVEAGDETSVLACFEEGLRHGGPTAVVAELARLSMTASRRLQLAAESSGAIGIAVRRWRRQTEAADFGQPTASVTRWRVTALSSSPLPVPGVGRGRWHLELIRARAGESADFEVEAPDASGHIALPSELAYRPALSNVARRFAGS